MPELPEVQNVVNNLHEQLVGLRIVEVDSYYDKLFEKGSYPLSRLCGQTLNGFMRRGKYIVIQLDDCQWITHLRMEGRFYIYPQRTDPSKHTQLRFSLEDGRDVHFVDTRKFGRMMLCADAAVYFQQKMVGLEPFSEELNKEWLHDHLARHRLPIKSALLDQHIICGIGNIYADEILFALKLHPLTLCNQLTLGKCGQLIQVTREILSQAIAQGGTTVRSFESSHHITGLFQVELKAYGRAGQPCPRCLTPLKRLVIGGRSSVYCPHCQRRRGSVK